MEIVRREDQETNEATETLAERFWSVANAMQDDNESTEPKAVCRHVLAVLDAFQDGQHGDGVTARTRSFLALLRRAEIRGDLMYASPEQARGERVDERSLVFSVGVLLFERLTGRHPFGAEANARRVARIKRGEMGSGVNFFPTVPTALRNILMRAMGPFPQERFPTLAALRLSVEDFLSDGASGDEPILRGVTDAPSPQPPERSRPYEAAPPRVTPRRIEVVQSVPIKQHPPTEPVAALSAPSDAFQTAARNKLVGLRRAAPLAWALIGAAVASLFFILLAPRGPVAVKAAAAQPEVSVMPAAAAPAPTPTAAPTPAPAPTATAAPLPEPTAIAAPAPEPTEPAVPAAFDAAATPDLLRPAVEACISGKTADFGVSVVFNRAGRSTKIFLGASTLTLPEKKCLSRGLVGVEAGAADRGMLVEYAVHVRGTRASLDVRHVK